MVRQATSCRWSSRSCLCLQDEFVVCQRLMVKKKTASIHETFSGDRQSLDIHQWRRRPAHSIHRSLLEAITGGKKALHQWRHHHIYTVSGATKKTSTAKRSSPVYGATAPPATIFSSRSSRDGAAIPFTEGNMSMAPGGGPPSAAGSGHRPSENSDIRKFVQSAREFQAEVTQVCPQKLPLHFVCGYKLARNSSQEEQNDGPIADAVIIIVYLSWLQTRNPLRPAQVIIGMVPALVQQSK